jgi:hypothetical protein
MENIGLLKNNNKNIVLNYFILFKDYKRTLFLNLVFHNYKNKLEMIKDN